MSNSITTSLETTALQICRKLIHFSLHLQGCFAIGEDMVSTAFHFEYSGNLESSQEQKKMLQLILLQ